MNKHVTKVMNNHVKFHIIISPEEQFASVPRSNITTAIMNAQCLHATFKAELYEWINIVGRDVSLALPITHE